MLVLFTTLMFIVANAAPATAANKTITCYKGTIVKKVTAAKPKCPTGYTTTKPKVTTKPTAPAAAATVAFSGTYKGSLAIVWGDTYLQVTSVTGKGTGNVLGLTDMSGTAAAAPAGPPMAKPTAAPPIVPTNPSTEAKNEFFSASALARSIAAL